MSLPLFFVSLVETLNKLGKLLWYAFIDDIGVHRSKLLTELVLDIRAEPSLLALGLLGLHGRIRRLPDLVVHLTLPPVPIPMAAALAVSLFKITLSATIGSLVGTFLVVKRLLPICLGQAWQNTAQSVRRDKIMLTTQAVKDHLPILRRYARALTGSQESGDSYVAAALEALTEDPKLIDQQTSVRVGMFRVFSRIWNSLEVNAGKEPINPRPADRHLGQIGAMPRQAFLLVSLEGFSEEDAAKILGI